MNEIRVYAWACANAFRYANLMRLRVARAGRGATDVELRRIMRVAGEHREAYQSAISKLNEHNILLGRAVKMESEYWKSRGLQSRYFREISVDDIMKYIEQGIMNQEDHYFIEVS